MHPGGRRAVVLRDETARIGPVAGDAEPLPAEGLLGDVDDVARGAGAESVAEDDVRLGEPVPVQPCRRHRMGIDQDAGTEDALGPLHEAAQRRVVRAVEPVDPRQPLGDRDPSEIDLLRITDDSRDRPQPASDPHRAGIGEGRHPPLEHPRIELVGLPVDVQIGPREFGDQQRRPERDALLEQPVDEGVLGAPQAPERQPRLLDEAGRVAPPGMRYVDDHRHHLQRRRIQGEGPLDLADDLVGSGGERCGEQAHLTGLKHTNRKG